jgi:probable phosphoglycerate mutase
LTERGFGWPKPSPRLAALAPTAFSSHPLGRARATPLTARPRREDRDHLPWARKFDWREEVPPWGDRVIWDIPGEVIHEKVPPPLYDDWDQLPPIRGKGYREKMESLQRDSDHFIESLGYRREGGRYRIVRSHREKVAVFCHGGFGLQWFAHLFRCHPPWCGRLWMDPLQ